ncbi:hypothetical protein Pcinc_008999 [Petrolisthes cinctipes]|uniref:G-protein coupled receptors family 1 profile domain-containing protein n=1 Tax=Petrolisthes cinctipes TaxID=88211 RepID=A0AAE1G651_PETCI|nr:hypothetical protein Pcinc_008999 [Petrolisthes cinctipes]
MLLREHQRILQPVFKGVRRGFVGDIGEAEVSRVRYVAYGVVAPFLVTVGLLGNLFTIFILRLPQFRGVTYTYFLLLALSDFLSLAFSISFLHHLLSEATLSHATAVWYSHCELFFVNVPMTMSIFIILCITIDRFLSVCRPVDFKQFHTTRYARAGLLGSLLVAVLVWCPIIFLKEPKVYSECPGTSPPEAPDNRTWWVAGINNKTANSSLYTAYSWIRQSVVIFLPAVVLALLNSLTVREFIRVRKIKEQWNSRQELPGQSSVELPRQPRDDNLVKLLMVVTISFFITLVPAGVSNAIYTQIYSTEKEFEIFMSVTNDLEILNHAMNFYLYMLCSKPIREAIKHVCSRQYTRLTSSIQRLKMRKPSTGDVNPGSFPAPTVSTIDLVSHRHTNTEINEANRNDREKTLSAITLSSDVASDKTSHTDPSEVKGSFSHSSM